MEREKKFQATADTNKLGDILREQENDFYGRFTGKWEGQFHGKPVGTPVVTRYPNLLAEMVASGYTCDVERLSNAALVSPEVLVAVIEDGEELSEDEMLRVAGYLNFLKFGRYLVFMNYLASPALSFVRPKTRKGRVQAWQFERMYDKARYLAGFGETERKAIATTRTAFAEGRPFYYADYRYAMCAMDVVIRRKASDEEYEKRQRARTRTTRKGAQVHA